MTSQSKTSWAAFDLGAVSAPSTSSKQSQPLRRFAQPAVAGLLPPPGNSSLGSSNPKTSRSRPRGRTTTGASLGRSGVISLHPPASSQSKQSNSPSQPSSSSASSASKSMVASTINPQNKVEVSTKKSGSYMDELSSLSMQPQIPPMNMNYQAGGGPVFHQQLHDVWGSPSIVSQAAFPLQQQQPPVNIPYGLQQGSDQCLLCNSRTSSSNNSLCSNRPCLCSNNGPCKCTKDHTCQFNKDPGQCHKVPG